MGFDANDFQVNYGTAALRGKIDAASIFPLS